MLTFVSKAAEPWRRLPSSLADAIEPGLPEITRAILTAIGQEVPDYVRPLEGAFGAALAEAIFAYIDSLSADSVEGYAQAQSEFAGERERRRAELVAALLGRAPGVDAAALATILEWPLPRSAAALACPNNRLAGLAR